MLIVTHISSDNILDQFDGPVPDDQIEAVGAAVGAHFESLTSALQDAQQALSSMGNDTQLIDEDGDPCTLECIADKTGKIVKGATGVTGKSVLKLGLRK